MKIDRKLTQAISVKCHARSRPKKFIFRNQSGKRWHSTKFLNRRRKVRTQYPLATGSRRLKPKRITAEYVRGERSFRSLETPISADLRSTSSVFELLKFSLYVTSFSSPGGFFFHQNRQNLTN